MFVWKNVGLTDNLHSLTHKCLSLYEAIQQDFFFTKNQNFPSFVLVNGLLAIEFLIKLGFYIERLFPVMHLR